MDQIVWPCHSWIVFSLRYVYNLATHCCRAWLFLSWLIGPSWRTLYIRIMLTKGRMNFMPPEFPGFFHKPLWITLFVSPTGSRVFIFVSMPLSLVVKLTPSKTNPRNRDICVENGYFLLHHTPVMISTNKAVKQKKWCLAHTTNCMVAGHQSSPRFQWVPGFGA